MKRNKLLISIAFLLILDVITTLWALRLPGAYESNPINTIFPNYIIEWIIVNHILAFIFLLFTTYKYDKSKQREDKRINLYLTLLIIFYCFIVISNLIHILI